MTMNNRINRRGVTLLIVLSLMTMFALLVVAFMVITTQARRAAEHAAQAVLKPKDVSTETDVAIQKLLIGDKLESVIGPHSILENLYGHPCWEGSSGDGNSQNNLQGSFSVNTAQANGYIGGVQFTPITTSNASTDAFIGFPGGFGGLYDRVDLVGNVITVTEISDPTNPRQTAIKGKSTFIIDINNPNNIFDTILSLAPFPGVELGKDDLKNCRFIINSPQFGGTGPGFIYTNSNALPDADVPPGVAALAGEDSDVGIGGMGVGRLPQNYQTVKDNTDPYAMPLALRPNPLAPGNAGVQRYRDYLKNSLVLMNPDYTAPDYRSMFLAWNNVQYDTTWKIERIIPSFHRPQLVRYWFNGGSLSTPLSNNDKTQLRKVVLRPLPTDHPKFTGSNPAAKYDNPIPLQRDKNLVQFLTNGPWDVDNDGDGIADGVWLDAGLGTVTIDDKEYKKLVSYYVLDMDGRINVNVHGNQAHEDSTFDNAGGGTYDDIPVRGSGSGSAEVRLDLALKNIKADNAMKLIGGGTGGGSNGRYGTDLKPGDDSFPLTAADYAKWIKDRMGINYLAYGSYDGNAALATSGMGGHIPDLKGEISMAFDPIGNRYFGAITDLKTADLFKDNPYLMNPYDFNSGYDRLFDNNELQFLLRSVGDVDYRTLPPRLRELLGDTDQYNLSPYRLFLGSRSSDIPVKGHVVNSKFAGLYRHICHHIVSGPGGDTFYARRLYELLPKEIWRGEKVNLNRLTLGANWSATTVNNVAALREKAKFAQEIFYLLLVLNYDNLYTGNYPDGDDHEVTEKTLEASAMTYSEGGLTRAQVIGRLAQWSVNLVDFLDPDDVMTPLVYSTTPFGKKNGFVNNDTNNITSQICSGTWIPATNQRIVWGMEKPEIAITETFAVHNRRVADSILEAEDGETCACGADTRRLKKTGTGVPSCTKKHDSDFDQVMIPEGSLYVELYRQGNPNRSRNYPRGGTIVDGVDNKNQAASLDLARSVGGTPIWRLVIGEKNSSTTPNTPPNYNWGSIANPQDALYQLKHKGATCSFQTKQWKNSTTGCFDNDPTTTIVPERIIWFTSTIPTISVASDIKDYSYCSTGTTGPQLTPNEYLVITPRQTETSFLSKVVDGTNTTEFGTSDDSAKIQFDANINASSFIPTLPTNITQPKVMTAAATITDGSNTRTIGVSVSEPLPGSSHYPPPSSDGKSYTDPDVLKEPLDKDELASYGTIPCYRTICLQRLADPSRQHHPMTNPYVTVDWNMIDLHVINSEKDRAGSPDPIFDSSTTHGDLYFCSRQWGTVGVQKEKQHPNLWARNFDHLKDDGTESANKQVGYLNIDGGAKTDGVVALDTAHMTLGYLNKYPGTSPGTTLGEPFTGAPEPSFLHLPWHDAPFSNSYEPMLVPASSPDRFGAEFYDNETSNWVDTTTTESLGSGMRYAAPKGLELNALKGLGPYLNFFSGDLNLARLFEYVRVPSKFGGTIRGWRDDNGLPIYELREPGKINLNTATAPAWEALSGSSQRKKWSVYQSTTVTGLYNARHDIPSSMGMDDYPSEFIAPFRSPNAATLVPPLKKTGEENGLVQQSPTLFRKDGTAAAPFIVPEAMPDKKPDNPYTALESVMRLSDMTTTRSNVFAVWVTVGYFEAEHFANAAEARGAYGGPINLNHIVDTVDDNMFKAVYPDGYVLGAEKGLDNGTVKRHRAFYLIDRSTPVGFRRGDNTTNYTDVIVNSKILE